MSHYGNAITKTIRFIHEMRRLVDAHHQHHFQAKTDEKKYQNDDASFLGLFQQIPSPATREGIHATCWFIKKDNFGVAKESDSNTELTLLTAAQILRNRVALLG